MGLDGSFNGGAGFFIHPLVYTALVKRLHPKELKSGSDMRKNHLQRRLLIPLGGLSNRF